MKKKNSVSERWYDADGGFFGPHYIEGDNSEQGFREPHGVSQTLPERTREEVEGVVGLTGFNKEQSLLDVPCGYGRHLIGLREIFPENRLVGVDLNPDHLKLAEGSSVDIELHRSEMIKLDFDEEFDVLTNMFYSFGFYPTDEENKEVLAKFYKALKPGGNFLMHTDVNIPTIENSKYASQEERSLVSGETLVIEDQYDSDTRRMNGSWTIDGVKKDYSMRVFDVCEWEAWCKEAGFSSVKNYSNWSGAPYNEESDLMICVATK